LKPKEISIQQGPSGRPLLEYDGVAVHGPEDPFVQAGRWISGQVLPRAGLVAVLGLGLGYHLEALEERRPGAGVVVWEPLEGAAELFRVHGSGRAREMVASGRVKVVESLSQLKSELGRRYVYGPGWLRLAALIPEGYQRLIPEAAEELTEAVRLLILRRDSNLKTILRGRDQALANLSRNLTRLLGLPEATSAQGALAGVPAVVVAAGPSLDRNLEVLKRGWRKLAVISVGTVFKRLAAEGIQPDVAVMIEPRDRSAQVAGEKALASTILAASSLGHPAHLAQESLATVVFHPEPWIASLVGDWPAVPDGGNVASAGFTLALLWGCDPIILVGQDLAYEDGRRYSEGAKSPENGPDQEGLTALPGQTGGRVYASSELVSYLSWYEESAAYLARARPELRLINATEGGAKISGFESLPLVESLPGPGAPRPKAKEKLLQEYAGFKRDRDLVRLRLARFRREAAGLEQALSEIPLEEMMVRLESSTFRSFLSHLIGPPPASDKDRTALRTDLGMALEVLSGLAAQLQAEARAAW